MKKAIKLLKAVHKSNEKENKRIEKLLEQYYKQEKKGGNKKNVDEEMKEAMEKLEEGEVNEIVTFKEGGKEEKTEEKPEVDLKEFSTPDGSMSEDEKVIAEMVVKQLEIMKQEELVQGTKVEESEPVSDIGSPEKIWCGVCRKEHTRGTHD